MSDAIFKERENLARLRQMSQPGSELEIERRITEVVKARGIGYVSACRNGRVRIMGDVSADDLRALADAMSPR